KAAPVVSMLFWTCTNAGPAPPAASPVPVRLTACGLPLALSVTLNDALLVPLAVGVKVTLIVHCAPAATEVPQLLVCPKSPLLAPVMAMLEMFNVAEPMLLRVTACAALVVPTISFGNPSEDGDKRTTGPLAAVAFLNAAMMFPFQFAFV